LGADQRHHRRHRNELTSVARFQVSLQLVLNREGSDRAARSHHLVKWVRLTSDVPRALHFLAGLKRRELSASCAVVSRLRVGRLLSGRASRYGWPCACPRPLFHARRVLSRRLWTSMRSIRDRQRRPHRTQPPDLTCIAEVDGFIVDLRVMPPDECRLWVRNGRSFGSRRRSAETVQEVPQKVIPDPRSSPPICRWVIGRGKPKRHHCRCPA
jgi:hypothetical protein